MEGVNINVRRHDGHPDPDQDFDEEDGVYFVQLNIIVLFVPF